MEKTAKKKTVLSKKMTVVTVAGVIFALLLIIALIANAVRLGIENKKIKTLESDILKLEQLLQDNEEELLNRKNHEYIERYAREYLDMIKRGEIVYIGR